MARMISICIPFHGDRSHFVRRNLENLRDDPRVAEFVINDDASSIEDFTKLLDMLREFEGAPFDIRVEYNVENLFVFRNKIKVVERARCDWVALIDSDNVIDSSYLDAWEKWMEQHGQADAYLPVMGRPALDYRAYEGQTICRENVAAMVDLPNFETMANTMNFAVRRSAFLEATSESPDCYEPFTADSIWINYLLLKRGYLLFVTPGMQYEHTRHAGSAWAIHHKKGDGENERIKAMLREMK